tara:strand:- start:53 stop:265 length:213 start_codon:yes stop_codon:yes gene_type:complete
VVVDRVGPEVLWELIMVRRELEESEVFTVVVVVQVREETLVKAVAAVLEDRVRFVLSGARDVRFLRTQLN